MGEYRFAVFPVAQQRSLTVQSTVTTIFKQVKEGVIVEPAFVRRQTSASDLDTMEVISFMTLIFMIMLLTLSRLISNLFQCSSIVFVNYNNEVRSKTNTE